MKEKAKVLIVDDERQICSLFHKALSKMGYEVSTALSGKKAIKIAKKKKPNLVLLELELPDIDGLKVFRQLKKIKEDIAVIILTACGTLKTAREAMKLGAYEYITKPLKLAKLKRIIKENLHMQTLAKEVADLRLKVSGQ